VSGFLSAPAPRWFTIPAHRPFLGDLAAGIWRELSPLGAEALADAVILIPTRRAARSLAEAFLGAAGSRAVILPQIRALGDLDEGEAPFEAGDMALDLPPAISPLQRRFELAGLVVEHQDLLERRLDASGALDMADALAGFVDACQIEGVGDPLAIETLVEGELARHWRISADFLNIALKPWPLRLQALGVIDVAERQVALMRRLAERWREHPPAGVIIAAGSTGSAPAAADLLSVIAGAPRGCVVLPGLDRSLPDLVWREVGEQHPQGAMKRLLDRAGRTRDEVRDWDPTVESSAAGRWRRRLINDALRPPDATADWLKEIESLRAEGDEAAIDPIAEGLKGLSVVTARSEEEAATLAALLLREALETPGKTAALVSPDAALARRVSARLTRWNISADSSAGEPLAGAPAAVLASLVARFTADRTDPVTLLAILKHPLTRLGWSESDLDEARLALERDGLRGPRPAGWEDLNDRLQGALARAAQADTPSERRIAALGRAIELVPALRQALMLADAAYTGETATPGEAARALVQALESLAAGPRGGGGELWGGQGGESLGILLSSLIAQSEALPEVTRKAFAELIDGLAARELLRPGGASHPRLRIMGVLEARLVRADLVVLAGLEEGMWPAGAPIDPFLSRPMRERLGLPPPERRIGLSAHDFAQAACGPEVVLLNSERRDGAPAVASRWLWRLRTLVEGAKLSLPGRPDLLAWARALDAPLEALPEGLKTAPRPNPRPPVEARPRKLAVTAIERWVRDPYGLYAREILKLRPLDRPDEPVEALARGSAIHAAFERFAKEHPDELPDGAADLFAALLMEELRRAGMPQARMARESALAANVAPWVIDFERRRRPGARLIVEQQGVVTFDSPGGPFTLTARADRIEARSEVADVLDFKTGQAPSGKMVRSGLAPQLTLTGAILAEGGFTDLGPLTPGDLLYVRVSGGRIPGREESRGDGEAANLAAEALSGLKRRVAKFDDPATGYLSWAIPQFIGRYGGDYDHLARLWEWHVVGEGSGEE
jgi:ATP-dependent helicase/nuclease subunit B